MACAVEGRAANLGAALPDDLGEVAELVEGGIRHVRWGSLVVERLEEAHLIVVHVVGDDRRDVGWGSTCGNVLAVAATVLVTVPR